MKTEMKVFLFNDRSYACMVDFTDEAAQKELTKTKLEYFTHISHELLTPLTTISCVADDLEETKASPQEDVPYIEK